GEAQIGPLLASGELGRRIHHFEEVDSTNDEALRLADAGALHGEVVIGDFQKHGRGRRGRAWVAPRGKAATFSVILRPAIGPMRAPEITLAAAVAVAEAARELGAQSARLLEHLEEWLSLHETEGFGPVADRWRELSSTLGRKVRITGDERPIEGDAVDLADDGALLVRAARGALVRVVAGDVEHCETL